MRYMMVSLNLACLILNALFAYNLTSMISRANRAKGSTRCIHYVALAFAVVAIFLSGALVFCVDKVKPYRYVQDVYFLVQMLIQIPLLIGVTVAR